jgi:hypothetical protein
MVCDEGGGDGGPMWYKEDLCKSCDVVGMNVCDGVLLCLNKARFMLQIVYELWCQERSCAVLKVLWQWLHRNSIGVRVRTRVGATLVLLLLTVLLSS